MKPPAHGTTRQTTCYDAHEKAGISDTAAFPEAAFFANEEVALRCAPGNAKR